jgi:O-antigen/teichoic acid export membrane protein
MKLSKLIYKSIFWRSLNVISLFVLNLFIARHFGADYFGDFFYVINSLSLFILFFSFCLETGLGYYVAKEEVSDFHAVLFSVFWSLVASTIILGVLFFFRVSFLSQNKNFLLFSFCFIAGNFLLTFFNNLFTIKQFFILPNVMAVFFNIGLCFLPFFYASSNNLNVGNFFQNYYFVIFFIQGILLVISYFFIFTKVLSSKPFTKNLFFKILEYSLKSFIGNIIFFLVYRIDYWLLNYFSINALDFGNYVQVSKLVQVFLIIPSIIATTIYTITAKGYESSINKNIPQLSRIIFSFVVIICFIIVLFGKWFFPFIFGETFTKMYLPFLLYMPGIAAIATLYPFTAFYAGANKIWTNIIGSLIALIVIVIGNIIFIPIAGINAAAAISSIGYVVYEIYVLFVFKKEYGLQIRDCFIIKKDDFKHIAKLLKS